MGGGGWAYNRMYVLFTGRRAYSGGGGRGGAMTDPDLQIRGEGGGGGHPVPEKKGEAISKKIRGGGGGRLS